MVTRIQAFFASLANIVISVFFTASNISTILKTFVVLYLGPDLLHSIQAFGWLELVLQLRPDLIAVLIKPKPKADKTHVPPTTLLITGKRRRTARERKMAKKAARERAAAAVLVGNIDDWL
jgi:hypothetical protein